MLRKWDPARHTRTCLLTDASKLTVSAILKQPDDAGVFHPITFEARKLTQPKRQFPPHLLELLAAVHALKTLRPYLPNKPFELHTDNASLRGYNTSATSVIIGALSPPRPPPIRRRQLVQAMPPRI